MIQPIIDRWSSIPRRVRLLLLITIVLLLPLGTFPIERATNFGLLTQINRALIFVVLALGLNIVVGFAGLLDLGYAAFFAIGAYGFGILTWPVHGLELTFFLAIWLCAAIASVFGIIVGSPTLRLRGDYLAIVTLAFGEIIPTAVRNLRSLTNGSQGMVPLGKPNFGAVESVFGLEPGQLTVGVDPNFWYYVIIGLVALVLFASLRLDSSRLGRAWKAIREDETAADFMGVDPIRTKLLAFAIGASFSGLAGAVFASMLGFISPDQFKFQTSIFLLIIVVLSGLGSIWGVLVGGLILSLFDGLFLAQVLPELLPGVDVQSLRWIFFGIGLIVIMIFRPQGLFPRREVAKAVEADKTPIELQASAAKGGD